MHYHLLLTEKCNSECRYCYKKSLEEFDNGLEKKFNFDFSAPETFQPNIDELKQFIEKDKDAVIIFYGGEPLLEIEKMKEIIDNINVPFRMQTNGKLLDKLPIEYLRKIKKILISIDGKEEITDLNRGEGTYSKIIKNIILIKGRGYDGEIIARMTLAQNYPDIFEQAKFLIENRFFDSVHWQLDAGFFKFDFNKKNFEKFVEEYNKSISRLIEYWIAKIRNGKVLKFYPFLGIVYSLLNDEKTKLRCGAGHSGYAIATNGKIVSCPVMNGITNFEAGDLKTNPNELKKFEIKKCANCEIKDACGGRCMYWREAGLWPDEGDKLICETVKHLIKELERKIPIIKEQIETGRIKREEFSYEKYFGPEIIP